MCFSLSTTDGVTTRYAYDAAGRMVREGNKTYRYGYLDKVMSVIDGDTTRTFTYHADGQLATANYGRDNVNRETVGRDDPIAPTSESFLWDGLALIQRGDEQFVNEPHVGNAPKKLCFGGKPRAKRSARRARKGPRGNPVASSKGTSYFNDALGTTVGSWEGRASSRPESGLKYSAAALTAFGESLETLQGGVTSNIKHQTSNSQNFFTGKPFVEGLGHAFLMRNYRAGLAKWQTADPMGYPDGWNQLAYCNNGVTSAVDFFGAKTARGGTSWDERKVNELVGPAPGWTLSNQVYIWTAQVKSLREEVAGWVGDAATVGGSVAAMAEMLGYASVAGVLVASLGTATTEAGLLALLDRMLTVSPVTQVELYRQTTFYETDDWKIHVAIFRKRISE